MLVLSRKVDESVQIGDEITVTVLKVKGNTVRIGIDAPKSVRVVRGELENHRKAKLETESAEEKVSAADQEPSAKGGLALSDSEMIIEFTNRDCPKVQSERFGDSCQTNIGQDRSESCHQLPLSRFTKPDYQVEHFRISAEQTAKETS